MEVLRKTPARNKLPDAGLRCSGYEKESHNDTIHGGARWTALSSGSKQRLQVADRIGPTGAAFADGVSCAKEMRMQRGRRGAGDGDGDGDGKTD